MVMTIARINLRLGFCNKCQRSLKPATQGRINQLEGKIIGRNTIGQRGRTQVRWAQAIPAPGHVLQLRRQGKRQLHFGPWGGNRISCVPSASAFLRVECRRQIRRPLRRPSDQQRVQVRQVVPLDNSAAFAGFEFVASYFV